MNEVVTIADESVQIEYCSEHYEQLKMSLLSRQLGEQISTTQQELIDKLVEGRMDPALEASNAITSSALEIFGPEAIEAAGGCPVCAFENVIDHVADHMAVKYRKTN